MFNKKIESERATKNYSLYGVPKNSQVCHIVVYLFEKDSEFGGFGFFEIDLQKNPDLP